MRTLLAVFCVLLVVSFSVEARKRVPASQKARVSKLHKAKIKKYQKLRKAPKHYQRVN